MSIKPILFNTDMVRAILDGRKTVTRRVVKGADASMYAGKCMLGVGLFSKNTLTRVKKPPYQPGDILYVRETWHKYKKRIGKGEGCHIAEFYGYKASIANSEDANEPWKPSIHMPKEAARIWLKVKDVRVERVKDITIEGIRNEGISSMAAHAGDMEIAQEEFQLLWNSTIKKSDLERYGWEANPYVFVIEFMKIDNPEEI